MLKLKCGCILCDKHKINAEGLLTEGEKNRLIKRITGIKPVINPNFKKRHNGI